MRKNRRRSNLFTPSAKGKEKFEEKKPGEVMISVSSFAPVYNQNMWNAVVTSCVIVIRWMIRALQHRFASYRIDTATLDRDT